MKQSLVFIILFTFANSNPFVCAYKDSLSFVKNNRLYFKDGTSIVYDRKNRYLDMDNVDMEDMIKLPYIKDNKKIKTDAGRYRNEEFFGKIYGKNIHEVKKNLVDIVWLKSSANIKIKFNKNNQAAQALQRVSDTLDTLDKSYHKFLSPIGGTFNYRYIKNTNRLSPHSFGIAIDLNTKYGSYWIWHKKFKNQIPQKIIDIFEKNGFIWGGRWKHFDTFHFEYRPEFTCK